MAYTERREAELAWAPQGAAAPVNTSSREPGLPVTAIQSGPEINPDKQGGTAELAFVPDRTKDFFVFMEESLEKEKRHA